VTGDLPGTRAAERFALTCVFALLAVLAFRQVASLDTGFHLKAGEHILSGKGFPRNDPFTFTLGDRPYVDTSWGFQVLAAATHRVAGASGLVGLDAMLVLAVFLVLHRTARLAPCNPAVLATLLLAGGLASEMRFEARPELLSWLYLAVVLHLLHRRAERRAASLWLLPAIHLLWANTHALFVLGWMAIACFLAGEAIRERRLPRDLLAWGAASVAATLINPYGARGMLFPLTLATRLKEENPFAQSIGEFVSPFALRLSSQFPFYPRVPVWSLRALFALAALAAVLSLFPPRGSGRRRRPEALLLFAAFAPLAFRMIRNGPILVLASVPFTAWALSELAPRRRTLRPALAVAVVAVAAVLTLRVGNDAYYIASRRLDRFGWTWNRLAVPADAARFADRVGLRGPALNHLNFGGFLMWARPDPVFIDGRLEVVGEDFYRSYQAMLTSESALEAAVARYGLRWIVYPYATNPQLLQRLGADARWRLAYFDHLAAIFVRDGPGAEALVDPGVSAAVSRPPRRGRLARWMSGCFGRQRFPSDSFYRGLFHYFRGEFPHAERRFTDAVRESRGDYYEIYNNLGSALWQQRRREEARACYRVVLAEDPDNQLARQRLSASVPR
jgi:hypothetical protein